MMRCLLIMIHLLGHMTDHVLNMVFRFLKTFCSAWTCATIGAKLHNHFIWLKNRIQESKTKGFVNIPFVNTVVLYGLLTTLKVMVYIQRQSFVHMCRNSVVVITDQSAIVFLFKWLLIISIDDILLH